MKILVKAYAGSLFTTSEGVVADDSDDMLAGVDVASAVFNSEAIDPDCSSKRMRLPSRFAENLRLSICTRFKCCIQSLLTTAVHSYCDLFMFYSDTYKAMP